MSDQRLDAMTPRKRGDKTYWQKVGSAWPNKNGVGWQIVLDALPLPDSEGRCVINLFEPKVRDGSEAYRDSAQPARPAKAKANIGDMDPDQEIPF